jgi:hypothetical protein
MLPSAAGTQVQVALAIPVLVVVFILVQAADVIPVQEVAFTLVLAAASILVRVVGCIQAQVGVYIRDLVADFIQARVVESIPALLQMIRVLGVRALLAYWGTNGCVSIAQLFERGHGADLGSNRRARVTRAEAAAGLYNMANGFAFTSIPRRHTYRRERRGIL